MDLQVHHLSVATNANLVVDDISFRVPSHHALAIIGPSGSGKTTLLRGIMGVTDGLLLTGQVNFGEKDHRTTCRFGYIPQDTSLWPHLSVKETLKLATHFSRRQHAPDDEQEHIARLMHACGLAHRAYAKPQTLSGGEKKRLALARALVALPDILILDEPFSGLDVVAKSELIALITSLKNQIGFSMIFVSHDLAETFALGDLIMVMDRGQSHWLGPKHELAPEHFLPHWNPFLSPLVSFNLPTNAT